MPALAFFFGMMLLNAPRIFATAYDSFFVQLHKVERSGGLHAAVGGLQMAILVLPALGIVVTFSRLGARTGKGAWTRTEGRPLTRFALVTAAAGIAAFLGYVWYPTAQYKPIAPNERGSLSAGIQQISQIPAEQGPAAPKEPVPFKSKQPVDTAPSKPKPAQTTQSSTNTTSTTTTQTPTQSTQTSTAPAATTPTTTTPTTTTPTTTTPTTTTP